ncbi:hypothetical protein KAU51_03980 [Candidatus Parcubacteria bacterium]|nr:hypothetical protein [Candidatus Parcubacteria bacterium]
MKCKLCGKECRHLGSHVWHAHGMLAIEYKEEFGLDHSFSLIDDDIREKLSEANLRNSKQNRKNLVVGGKKHRFKKGRENAGGYLSTQRKRRIYENLAKMNKRKKERCPVCNMIFDKLDSHLYNKHKLLRVNSNFNQNGKSTKS